MSTDTNLLISPEGQVVFMAIANPVRKWKSDDTHYVLRLKLTDANFRKEIEAINPDIIVTNKATGKRASEASKGLAEGEYLVRASSKYQPRVVNGANEEIEPPMFFSDTTATAKMILEPFNTGDGAGSIKLAAVVITSIEHANNNLSEEAKAARLAKLKETLRNATGG